MTATATKKTARFKLLAGKHTESFSGRTFRAGQVFESDKDRARQHGSDKFVRVGDDHPLTPPDETVAKAEKNAGDPFSIGEEFAEAAPIPQGRTMPTAAQLDAMSERDLMIFANDEEIDLKGATKKPDMLKAIKAVLFKG